MNVRQTLVCLPVLMVQSLAAQTPEAIVTKRCLPCHNNQLDNAGLSFENQDSVRTRSAKILTAITHQGLKRFEVVRKGAFQSNSHAH